MRLLLVFWLLGQGVGFAVKAQDLTGQWTGSSIDNVSDRRQKIVLNIAYGDSLFGGVLHYYYPETQYFRNFIVRGQFHSKDSTVSIREDSLEESRNPPAEEQDSGQGPFVLDYKRTGHKEVLEGRTSSITIRLEKKAPPFIPLPPVTLHKKKDSAQLRALQPMLARQTPLIMAVPVPIRLDSV